MSLMWHRHLYDLMVRFKTECNERMKIFPSLEQTRPRVLRTGVVIVVALSVWVLAIGLFYVRTRMQLIALSYEITALQKKYEALNKRKTELLLEFTSLKSPTELEAKAKTRAGLVFPSINRVVHVR